MRKAATEAATSGGLDNWRWSLKLTSMLLRLDPQDAAARTARATASRGLGQRTTSANARGFYITEALQLEGGMLFKGQPVTLDVIRGVMVISTVDSKGETHVDVSRKELAEFVLGQRKPAAEALAALDSSLDRSHFILNPFAGNPECVEAQKQAKQAAHGEGEH